MIGTISQKNIQILATFGSCFLPHIQIVNGFSLVSQINTILAHGSAIDDNALDSGLNIFPLGIQVNSNENLHDDAKTKCYVSIGNVNGLDRTILDSPTMCLDLKFFNNSATSSELELPDGVVSAMDGSQAKLFSFNYRSSSLLEPNLVELVNLPGGSFPAVMTTEKQVGNGGVFLALHDSSGLLWNDLSMSSDNDILATWKYLRQMTYPNKEEITDSYSPTIFKYNITTGEEIWQTPFDTSQGKTFITGMETIPSRKMLIVLGSTNGYGTATGEENYSGEVWDGFLTLVDSETGKIENHTYGTYQSHSTRIRSQYDQDDLALGLCISDDKVFVVGSTTGKIEGKDAGGGFVMKIDVDTLDIIWKKQLVGDGVEATHCDVVENDLFVGGNVGLGTRLEEKISRDVTDTIDVFVASFNAYDGEIRFLRQIDSRRDDQLVGLKIHPTSGKTILTANAWNFTTGTVNLYILSINQEGKYEWQNVEAGYDPIAGVIPTKPTDEMIPVNPPQDNYPSDKKEDNGTIIAVVIVLIVVIAFVLTVFFYRKSDKEIIVDDLDLDPNIENISGENKIV